MSGPDKIRLLVGAKLVVRVAQLVRAPDCGSGGRGFESRLSPFGQTAREPRIKNQSSVKLKLGIYYLRKSSFTIFLK